MNNPNEFELKGLTEELIKEAGNRTVDAELLSHAIRASIDTGLLIQNTSEVLRIPAEQVGQVLQRRGFDIPLRQVGNKSTREIATSERGSLDNVELSPFREIFSAKWSAGQSDHRELDEETSAEISQLASKLNEDPFAALYRDNVGTYFSNFMETDAQLITQYLDQHFGDSGPEYIVTTGIGANEQFCHFLAHWHNTYEKGPKWLLITHPADLSILPSDATTSNTIFLEFSRSGVTEETIKLHEFTDPLLPRIVFANQGPLKQLGQRDNNLVLDLPDQVSGRYGRNKTPIVLAPMLCCGMDVESYWNTIQSAIDAFNFDDTNSLPLLLGGLIRQAQKRDQRKLIYNATNDPYTKFLGHELEQFWNEGVNKSSNLLMMSTFQGLPRDSHMTIEGLLGNADSTMSIFIVNKKQREPSHPLVSNEIRPVNSKHIGLSIADVENVLALANYDEFSSLMPTLLISIENRMTIEHSAIIGQLFADITFIYSRLTGVDPGSNPCVRNVRDRSSVLLARGT